MTHAIVEKLGMKKVPIYDLKMIQINCHGSSSNTLSQYLFMIVL